MKLLKIFVFTIFIILQLAATSQDKYIAKIAVVDVESILENSLAMSDVRKSMNELGEKLQQENAEKEKEFKKYEETLIERRSTLSQEDFETLATEFNKNVSITHKNIQMKKHALDQAYSEAIDTVHKTTISIIGELAKQYNFNIVLPSNQVLFVTNELNITVEVIGALNNQLKHVPINYEKFLK